MLPLTLFNWKLPRQIFSIKIMTRPWSGDGTYVTPGSPMALCNRVGTLRTAALIAATIVAWLAGGAFALASSGCEAVQGGRLSLKDGVVEFAAVDGFAVGDKVHYQIKAGPRDGSGGLVVVLPGGATSNIASVNGFGAVHGTYTVQSPLDSIIASASGSGYMTVQCTPAPLKLKSQPSSTHQAGQSYSQTNAGSGGTTPYIYSYTGTLPAGTTLDTKTGTVSGTATAAGPFSYTIKITDGSSPPQMAANVMSGMIEPPTLTMPATVTATGQVGQSYSQTNEAKGGTPPYTYLLARGDTLPDGTTLDPKTGTVSGKPTKAAPLATP
ncbi:MAG: Ig domain-containing protein [Xanthobacteraceae bacterium]